MFEHNSQGTLRILALIDDQFARMRYDVWPIPMTPKELADEFDRLLTSTEPARDYGERLSIERRSAGYEH